MFTNIFACWPGNTHDSHVFHTSSICTYLETNNHSLDDGILLGDSGYACTPYLMTPYPSPSTATQENYNTAHTKTKVVVEQSFGWWKRRFHVLHSEVRMTFIQFERFSLSASCSSLPIRRISIQSFFFFSSSISCCSFRALCCSSSTSACEIRFFLGGGNDERSSSTCRITVLSSTRLSFITSLDDTVGKFGWSWSSAVSASAGLNTVFNNNEKFCINLTPEI